MCQGFKSWHIKNSYNAMRNRKKYYTNIDKKPKYQKNVTPKVNKYKKK